MTTSVPVHSRISPTAKLVAHWRQFSDIPYATRVAELMSVDDAVGLLVSGFGDSSDASALNIFAPFIEARYKSVVAALKREGVSQVLELASGLSLRGLALTAEDPNMTYVETDLRGMHEEKARLAETLASEFQLPRRDGLTFAAANVLAYPELEAAVRPVDIARPLAVIHEGLFQYLSLDEKVLAAQNIRRLLSRGSGGGLWITPDIVTKREFEDGHVWGRSGSDDASRLRERMTGIISEVTGRDFHKAAFEDDDHVRAFFADTGFSVQKVPQLDGSFELTSASRFAVSPEILGTIRATAFLWILRPMD